LASYRKVSFYEIRSLLIFRKLKTTFHLKGANILIQRLMIQNNKMEPFTMFTFDSEINPCPVNYVRNGVFFILILEK